METIQVISYITTIIANLAVVVSAIIALRQLFKMKKANEISEKNIELIRKTYKEEHTRNLRQNTIEFYNEINKETKDFIDDIIIKKIDLDLSIILNDDVLHKRIRRYLSLMERFSVGINSHMYDLTVFDRIQGRTTLIMYNALKPYIDYISEKYGTHFYGEFLSIIEQIEQVRKKRRDAGYSEQSERFPTYIDK